MELDSKDLMIDRLNSQNKQRALNTSINENDDVSVSGRTVTRIVHPNALHPKQFDIIPVFFFNMQRILHCVAGSVTRRGRRTKFFLFNKSVTLHTHCALNYIALTIY